MKELKVGMYVRTKKGKIYKFDTDNSMAKNGAKKYMVNCSYNLIDLIEVGDYVNGRLVINASDVYTTDFIYIGKEVFIELQDLIIEEDIKTIVTKEQFESMEYKVC